MGTICSLSWCNEQYLINTTLNASVNASRSALRRFQHRETFDFTRKLQEQTRLRFHFFKDTQNQSIPFQATIERGILRLACVGIVIPLTALLMKSNRGFLKVVARLLMISLN